MASETRADMAGVGEFDDVLVAAVEIDDPDLDPTAFGLASRARCDAFSKDGFDGIEAGRVDPHDQVMAEMRALVSDCRASACGLSGFAAPA